MRDDPLVELRILGSVRISSSDGRDVELLVRHPKRTALLAYLGAARPRGPHRRDSLLGLFWPESDASRARAALNQGLYVLRKTLGDHAIASHGDGDVSLNPDIVWCDAQAFESALDAGLPNDALALYRGDLLEGFFVSGAPEFERWLEAERARLRERASQGAWAIAEARAAAGDAIEAARWARRASDLLAADEAVARRLMRFLSDLGDRAAAMHAYHAFAARLARDYELEPSAETRALAELIRETDEPGTHARADSPAATHAQANVASVSRLPSRSVSRYTKRPAALLALLVIGLLGGWFLLQSQLDARRLPAPPKRIVVLPFANLGPAEEEYFADGITEEIAARLAASERLRVIGKTTAHRYKGTAKTTPEIGRELDVSYVLEGSVRWQKSPDGKARIRVISRLTSATDGTHLWAEVYDEPFDEIFRVQSDIAGKVARALDLALLDPQRRRLESVPTRRLDAYDYYLRGNDYMSRGVDARDAYAAAQMYEKAVALDPAFALAYARLGRVHARIYWYAYDRSEERLARAKRAVDRAFELAPDLPQVHLALGVYYWHARLDYDRALQEFAVAEAGLPNDTDVLATRAVLRQRQGRFHEGLDDYAKAWQLDPGSALIAHNYAAASGFAREFVRAESLYDRALELAPDWYSPYHGKAGLYLRWQGSTQKASALLEQARVRGVAEPLLALDQVLVDWFDRRYDDVIAGLSSGFPEVLTWQFQIIPRAQLYAQVHASFGRQDLAYAYYDSARQVISRRLQSEPNEPRLYGALGIAYAGLGRKQEAIDAGRKAVELLPMSKEAHRGYYREWDLARIYAMVGEHEAALDRLEHLLSISGHLTPAWLRIDPTWDPLRGSPRFQRLVARNQ